MLHPFLPTAIAVLCVLAATDAFQVPLPLVAKQTSSMLVVDGGSPPPLLSDSLWSGVISAASPHHPAAPAAAIPTKAVSPMMKVFVSEANNFWLAVDGGAWDVARNIGLGLTAIVFLLAGLTFLYASFIIPQAAKELEKECKELNPQLWDEYQAKLAEGETIATRPDLMQEMGQKLQPLLDAKIRAMDAEKEGGEKSLMPRALETTMNPMGSASETQQEENDEPTITIPSKDQWDK